MLDVLTWASCVTLLAHSLQYFQGRLRMKQGQGSVTILPGRIWDSGEPEGPAWCYGATWWQCSGVVACTVDLGLNPAPGLGAGPLGCLSLRERECTWEEAEGVVCCMALNEQPAGGSSTSACWSSC